jgi:AcrR family transcriptional regulator
MSGVTMSQIATEAGISRSTLLRYFPTKLDIVWDRSDDESKALERMLAEVPPGTAAIDALCSALPHVLDYTDDELDLLRTQVSIIGATPGGSGPASSRFATWRSVVFTFIERRTGCPPESAFARSLVQTLADVGWTGLIVWAETDELRPDRILNEVYGYLRSGFRSPETSSDQ